jgi:hypothetical protein
MKKVILTVLISVPFLLFGQSGLTQAEIQAAQGVTIPLKVKQPVGPDAKSFEPSGKTQKANIKTKKSKSYEYVTLAETYYDLQTNSSPGRRVILHDDGTISAVWTMSGDDNSGWPNRGSGYNHYNGSDWMTGVTERIESTARTGWPSIFRIGNEEGIMAHESNTGGFVLSKNGSIGGSTWTSSSPLLDDVSVPGVNRVPIWNRTVSGNGYLHTISNYWFSEENNVPMVEIDGVSSPTTYSRSSDGGQTWDIEHILLPGYDSSMLLFGGGDRYAIDVKDSVVAIVVGGYFQKVLMWKSTDNGDTWTMTNVDSFPGGGVNGAIIPNDTLFTNDGSMDVLIDDNNEVHVFYGAHYFVDADTSDGMITIYPTLNRILHWKEGDTAPKICGGLIDMDGDPNTPISITEDNIPRS